MSSSGSGSPKNPPTSAPEDGRPARPSASSIGTETRSWGHEAVLSPVQMGPTVCDPAKNARESTKGRSPSLPLAALPLSARPWEVAAWKRAPKTLCASRCSMKSSPPFLGAFFFELSSLTRCLASLGIVISGPLNTLGSFMSFQM